VPREAGQRGETQVHRDAGVQRSDSRSAARATTYPALDRLMKAAWIEDRWEDPAPTDRPRRRLYTITSAGRAGLTASRDERARRGLTWATPGLTGGAA
jgi:DNA-binding PadR family transcriptional regulator